MTATNIATLCVDDVEARLKTLKSMKSRVFHMYSESELLDETKGLVYPCMGVVYDGMRAVGDGGKQGISAEIVVTIMVLFRGSVLSKEDPKDTIVALLDDSRALFRNSPRSPSGHFWKFQVESAIDSKKGVLTYIQRWATPVQLP